MKYIVQTETSKHEFEADAYDIDGPFVMFYKLDTDTMYPIRIKVVAFGKDKIESIFFK